MVYAQPPAAPVKVVTEDYFGTSIADPYRYMENLEDEKVQAWLKSQTAYANSILHNISGRSALIEKMKEFDQRKSAKITEIKITENDRYFYLKRTPTDESGKLFYRIGFQGVEELLFDPEKYNPSQEMSYVINAISPNHDGSKIALEIAPNGSENAVLIIIDVDKKQTYPEEIDRCWYAGSSWLPDGNSFLYYRINSTDIRDPNRLINTKSFLHQVGTDPQEDKVMFSREKYPKLAIRPEEMTFMVYDKNIKKIFLLAVTVDRYFKAFVAPSEDLFKEKIAWKPLFGLEDKVLNFDFDSNYYYIKTSLNAPSFKLIKIPIDQPEIKTAEEVVSASKNAILDDFTITKNGLFYTLVRNGVESSVYFQENAAKSAKKLKLPFAAGNTFISSKGYKFEDFWIKINGWTSDYRRFKYNANDDTFEAADLSPKPKYPEFSDLKVEELMISSHDGVKVPLSLIYDSNLKRDGSAPILILGYGAYGISINPFFNPNWLLWTKQGGIFAVAHVRGGGELGDQWHMSGQKSTKPNTWKDLIACTEYLHQYKYSSPHKTAIFGGSAGGILIGRAMTERPDLFATAIPLVGVMNPLRAEYTPTGKINVPEFGTSKIEEEFKYLVEMDAYLHVEDGVEYPATLVTSGMNDPRVIAWQPAKFAARLQKANASDEPILFLTDFEAGHGIGSTKSKGFEEKANIFSFSLWQSEHPDFKLKK